MIPYKINIADSGYILKYMKNIVTLLLSIADLIYGV